ncbi:unnamed protein product [Microthlaspi erraticum]|uniref:Integrase catalytic domain-containing protein n=1 Tax=Microthlaspi erraticum TaxID=1685480 RepID=A0A6D2KCT9_9BRAS|nr:unnamed protein product [Microthlaspi erraticum]
MTSTTLPHTNHIKVKDLNSGVPLIQGKTKDELYEWPASMSTINSFFASSSPKTTLVDWHNRLGHPSLSTLKSLLSSLSIPFSQSVTPHSLCSDCSINKSHKLPFSQSSIVSTKPLEYIFSDVWTSPVISIDNFKYYLVLIDHYTRYTWLYLYPLKTKAQVKDVFIPFKALVENKFNTKIGTFYSDNGGEFVALRSFLSASGISHLTSPPHTPEHNGISERKHRHIVETGLTLLTHAGMPKSYWTYAFAAAVYLINRLPTPVIDNNSPFQKLFATSPNYSKLRVFGCLCFPWIKPYNSHKLEDRSTPCAFIGYSPTQSAYLCLQPSSGRIYVSRHVKFDEHIFPFQKQSSNPPSEPLVVSPISSPPISLVPLPVPLVQPSPGPPSLDSHQTVTASSTESTSSSSGNDGDSDSHSQRLNSTGMSETTPLLSDPISPSPNPLNLNPTINENQNNSPSPNPNTSTNSAHSPNPQSSSEQSPSPTNSPSPINSPSPPPPQPNLHQMQTRRKNNIFKPNLKYNLSAALSTHIPAEPRTVNQALKDKRWRGAMSHEIDAFAVNRTFDLLESPL